MDNFWANLNFSLHVGNRKGTRFVALAQSKQAISGLHCLKQQTF